MAHPFMLLFGPQPHWQPGVCPVSGLIQDARGVLRCTSSQSRIHIPGGIIFSQLHAPLPYVVRQCAVSLHETARCTRKNIQMRTTQVSICTQKIRNRGQHRCALYHRRPQCTLPSHTAPHHDQGRHSMPSRTCIPQNIGTRKLSPAKCANFGTHTHAHTNTGTHMCAKVVR